MQIDITGIIDSTGQEIAKYDYDAWGNHKILVLNNGTFVDISENVNYIASGSNNKLLAEINPFRYRGYYYDSETGLYYLNSRYYDPETGRFINADDVSMLDATQDFINGLNLYVYCLNNPVNDVDTNGALSWWQWLLVGIGAALVVAAAVVLTVASGGALGGIIGTIAVGAAKGALIGAAVGTVAGGVIGGATTGWSAEGILTGMAIGFGAGAIIGAVVGASISGIQVLNASKAWASTSTKSSMKVMSEHYTKHVINEGQQKIAKNIVKYTIQAKDFVVKNAHTAYRIGIDAMKIAGEPGAITTIKGLLKSFWLF